MSTEIDLLESIKDTHVDLIQYGFDSLSSENFQKAADLIVESILKDRRIYTIGNGASAAIAQHWACDYTKGCSSLNSAPPVRPHVISLAANVPMLTAIGNDIGYEHTYSYQLKRLADPEDLLITISSSGNSPNIVRALEAAKQLMMNTISLTGFNGGACKNLCDVSLHVEVHEYEAAEDVHQAIMHMLAKYIRTRIW